MGMMALQIISLTIVYSTVYSGADQRKNQSSASLAFVLGIHWWLVNSPHKGPVTRKMFPFGDVIMKPPSGWWGWNLDKYLQQLQMAWTCMSITNKQQTYPCYNIPSSLWYKTHLSSQLNCWSFIYSWSIACRRCSNYIFILDLTPGFNEMGKDNCKTRWESFKFWDLVRLILEILRYTSFMEALIQKSWADESISKSHTESVIIVTAWPQLISFRLLENWGSKTVPNMNKVHES